MPKYRVELDVKTFVNMSVEVEADGPEQAEEKAIKLHYDVLAYMEPAGEELYDLNKKIKGGKISDITIGGDDDGPDVNEIEELP